MIDKYLRQILFGRTVTHIDRPKSISMTLLRPAAGDDTKKAITFRTDDGLIVELLKRIERLEEQNNVKTPKKL